MSGRVLVLFSKRKREKSKSSFNSLPFEEINYLLDSMRVNFRINEKFLKLSLKLEPTSIFSLYHHNFQVKSF